ncbi:extracellular catalytic domain type 1 short-chain-length polyhydroxyalkanoate depolymerase [Xylophilus sp.]|uniref:extracellular catalytic domain type 1 short-chain-length polyhydroxyalkanoate depolymerase n=1 Tax=Xylophilus sp. TaxID=2653893 RepID=UPI0013B61342|nr:PHB depolymerase family esterase [Xylophilus sp.]KAF1047437.1 MAG: Multifunctional esterase [Xylophilus sp.]
MNELFQRLMGEATRLTRNGRLHEATEAIRRALRGRETGTKPSAAPPPPPPHAHEAEADALVLDGLTRIVVDNDTEETSPAAFAPSDERWIDGRFAHQGRTLAYKLYLPPVPAGAVPSPRPLVVMLHGCTQDAADFAAGTQMHALARDLGVVVLYPEQSRPANPQKCWNWFKPQHQQRGRGEPAALAALAQSVAIEHGVDGARIFVAGLSAGGAMAHILGRCYPDVFAAVGVHSGLPSGCASDVPSALAAMRRGAATPEASAAPPTIVFHGDADTTVHAANGAAVIAADAGLQRSSARTVEGRSARGQRYTRTVYGDADGRSAAEYWQLHGAGHAWSGGSAEGSYTDAAGADASAEMLRFFLAHLRRA